MIETTNAEKILYICGFPTNPSYNSRIKNEEDSSDLQDLVMSFYALEEKVLEQYTYAKVLLRSILNLYGIHDLKRQLSLPIPSFSLEIYSNYS